MGTFLLRRAGLGLITLVGASILVFVLTNTLSSNVVMEVLMGGEGGASIPQKTIDKIMHNLGYDRPLVVQYFDWMRKIGTGEMGYSYTYKSQVGELIKLRITPTIHIAIQAVTLSWIFGLPLGLISALRRNSATDYAARVISILGLSVPYFWIGVMVVWVMATQFGWFPPLVYVPFWRDPWVSTTQTLGPSAILAFTLMAYIARMSRSTLLEVLREDYIRTARAKGLRERTVIRRHALKIAVLPVLTLSAVHLGRVLGGSVVAEIVFSIQGLGSFTVEAVIRRDIVIVQNVVLLLSGVFVLVNTLSDMLLGWLDPRIRQA